MTTNFSFNVLRSVQTVIRAQTIIVRRFLSRATNDSGDWITAYSPDVTINVNVQPVTKSLYSKMGLDFEKDYVSILSVDNIDDLARDRSGDQVVIDSRLYETVGETDWQRSAGWNRIVCVYVGSE